MFKGVDLTGVEALTYCVVVRKHGGAIKLHLDAHNGLAVSMV